jgi:hypothetical protein
MPERTNLRPVGVRVSSILRVEASGKIGGVARHALDVIDRVHGIGGRLRSAIPVVSAGSASVPGGFRYLRSGEAVRIEFSPQSNTPHIDFSHEVGHFLDHQLIGEAGEYASRTADVVLAEWRAAVDASRACQRLADLREMQRVRVPQPGGRFGFVPLDRAYIRYLMRPQEIFARSYAQFIASESRESSFLDDLSELRAVRVGQITYPAQWNDDDFGAIQAALRGAIIALGWLR